MLLPSEKEALLVGDIVYFLDQAFDILEDADKTISNRDYFAIRYASQCAIEACIKIDGSKKTSGRFEQLFPDFDLNALKALANHGRHDYGNDDPSLFIDDLRSVLTNLHTAAVALRDAKIRSLS